MLGTIIDIIKARTNVQKKLITKKVFLRKKVDLVAFTFSKGETTLKIVAQNHSSETTFDMLYLWMLEENN